MLFLVSAEPGRRPAFSVNREDELEVLLGNSDALSHLVLEVAVTDEIYVALGTPRVGLVGGHHSSTTTSPAPPHSLNIWGCAKAIHPFCSPVVSPTMATRLPWPLMRAASYRSHCRLVMGSGENPVRDLASGFSQSVMRSGRSPGA